MVWSRHEETLEFGYRPVTETASFEDKQIYEVVVTNKNGKIETYQTTEEHPFWVHEFGWLSASALIAGMTLVDRNDETLTVISQSKLDKTDTVYNFTVDEFHTYHIGELGVWVHNADCIPKAWITQRTYKTITKAVKGGELRTEFVKAMKKGMVTNKTGQEGIKVVNKTVDGKKFEFELKILGKYGAHRLYGNKVTKVNPQSRKLETFIEFSKYKRDH